MIKSKVVICIQARTNSSRLPGKVLLPVCGLPLSVLAAKRAGYQSSYDTRVLISEENSDDYLASVLEQHGVLYYRGDLNNVLKRFVDALSAENDQTIVVRLTADNVFPDSRFIENIVSYFESNEFEYVCANGDSSELPYGLSAEVMRVHHLRKALVHANDNFDLEHVTPYIRRQYGEHFYKSLNLKNSFSRLRCTVDNLDDYLKITDIFSSCSDPIGASVEWLCNELLDKFPIKKSTNKLVLGTAQLGLAYGINNKTGKPDSHSASNLLSTAARLGVYYIDTARTYGDSEKVIGSWLQKGWQGRCKVITKLGTLEELNERSSTRLVSAAVEASLSQSCLSLGLNRIDVLMLHRTEHLYQFDGAVLKKLNIFKSIGVITNLGVSVQSPQELFIALQHKDVDFIQLPYNLFDHRWSEAITKIREEKKHRKITIHVRSVLLQGLLVSDCPKLWARANVDFDTSKQAVTWLTNQTKKYGYSSIYELCISYVNSLDWVDGIVVGCENLHQIKSNIEAINLECSNREYPLRNLTPPFSLSENTLNPALWK
ncbi:aldo/keto reductase [Vibrio sp. ZSDE26]|uniref:Aldo/keto reductase n=1 Tax=Vibrio amylolyticus TaxID=2847292 RepID=A0A9X2BKV0_9VIBR|nr:aldo/keto reductase [Vibrio amylolyticus]MCK6263258.1 aldo/keto reductase [Vibrio amylolyticus]